MHLFFLQLASLASSRRMLETLNAPSVLYTALAMTRRPPSVTVIKASTGLSKTPLLWLVQVSRKLQNLSSLSCLQKSNFVTAVPTFTPSFLVFFFFLVSFCCLSFNSVIESHLNLCSPSLDISEWCIDETDKYHAGMKHSYTLRAILSHAYMQIFEDTLKQLRFFLLYRCENKKKP